MGKFNQGGGFSGRDRSYDRNAPKQMFKATCAECGNECEVPFKPSGDRPVLCSLCFKQSRGEERSERRDDRGSFDRPRNEDRRMYDTVCAKCGKPCQVPFQPKPGRDIFCSDCFSRDKGETKSLTPNNNQTSASYNYEKHFEKLHAKLDKLIALLTLNAPAAVNKPVVAKSVEVIAKKEIAKSASAKATADKPEAKKAAKKEDKKIFPKKKTAKKK
jgi:CxxC-x17-CxxC domain-containing protein